MMKTIKRALALTLILALCVVTLAACGNNNSSAGKDPAASSNPPAESKAPAEETPAAGGDTTDSNSPAGKVYTYKNEDKTDFATNSLYSGFVSAIAGSNATLIDTLTLNDDGTYVLVKEEDLGDDNMAGDTFKFTYTYYGTYTVDGSKVILSAATKMDYEEIWPGILAGQGAASASGTDITDPDAIAESGFGATLFDTFCWQYLNGSIDGNCDQIVTLDGDSMVFEGPVE